jgi:hypothetical protein
VETERGPDTFRNEKYIFEELYKLAFVEYVVELRQKSAKLVCFRISVEVSNCPSRDLRSCRRGVIVG